jgi:hypothetical protein
VSARFPRDRLFVVLFDDLRDRPQETYAGVCRFLGIDDRFMPRRLGERVNRYVGFRSMRIRGIRRQLPSTLRIGRIVGRLNAREGSYPSMAPETRAKLRGTSPPTSTASQSGWDATCPCGSVDARDWCGMLTVYSGRRHVGDRLTDQYAGGPVG